MPSLRLSLRPGVDTELTPSDNRGGWSSSDRVRFREGRVEKLRGRSPIADPPHVTGTCRSLHWWVDLSGKARYAIGTNTNLEIWQDGQIWDITPPRLKPGLVSSDGTPYSLRIWSLDNFGQDLLAVPSGDALYQWLPVPTPTGPNPMLPDATVVPTAPPFNQGGLVTMPQRIYMLFGSSPDGATANDPLLIRWSDQEDFTVWQPTTTNFAGSFRLSRGSRINGAIQSPLGVFIWTDLDLWIATFEGQPNVFGFFQIGSNCNLIAQLARAVAGSTPYWMADHGFFTAGQTGPTQIPCTVWDYVYLDLDMENQDKCFAGLDYHFNEVFWFFPSKSGGTGEIDSYVKFNFIDNIWDAGRLQITAWTDQNQPGTPTTVSTDKILSQQDTTLDDNGQPIIAFAQSAFQDMADGSRMVYVDRFLPDFIWEGKGPDGNGPQADITLFFRRYPQDPPTACGPFTIKPDTEYVTLAKKHPTQPGIVIRPRGREWAIKIEWNQLDCWSRWGAPRLMVSEDGRWA